MSDIKGVEVIKFEPYQTIDCQSETDFFGYLALFHINPWISAFKGVRNFIIKTNWEKTFVDIIKAIDNRLFTRLILNSLHIMLFFIYTYKSLLLKELGASNLSLTK